jgi:hypothetical protein
VAPALARRERTLSARESVRQVNRGSSVHRAPKRLISRGTLLTSRVSSLLSCAVADEFVFINL